MMTTRRLQRGSVLLKMAFAVMACAGHGWSQTPGLAGGVVLDLAQTEGDRDAGQAASAAAGRLIFSPAHLQALSAAEGRVTIRNAALPDGVVDLELERFTVTTPHTRILVAGPGGAPVERPAPRVHLLRGNVRGSDTHVFLALSGHGATGHVQRRGRVQWLLHGDAQHAPAGGLALSVSAPRGGGTPLHVPVCGLDTSDAHPAAIQAATIEGAAAQASGAPPAAGLRQLEIAVESDYDFFELFGDLDAAAAYVMSLYGAVSDIYMRETGIRITLTVVRLIDKPELELAFMNAGNPFGPFASHWNTYFAGVPRDVAQFLTGRRNLPYGGVAYLSQVCTSMAFSVCGYLQGYYSDPAAPANDLWDITVVAHELGHNTGTPHTHDMGIDGCAFGEIRRGTIMSYCHTVPGGVANIDLGFHKFPRLLIQQYVATRSCVPFDCNANGIPDSSDLAGGLSQDLNGSGVPDECEDCNRNGVLDDADIAAGAVDADADGVPDACQPDCNGNGLPDYLDVFSGISSDLYGNNVPDECEEDCDGDLVSDYSEIQSNMNADIDRNVELDACQDCDGDGTGDFEVLAGAHDLWVGSALIGTLSRFHARSGVLAGTSSGVGAVNDVRTGPDGYMYASLNQGNRVVRLAFDGTLAGDFVTAGSGGLSRPHGLAFDAAGNLLVASFDTHAVLRYAAGSGAFLGAFVSPGAGGLQNPTGLTVGPDGRLYVASSATDEILVFDGDSGDVAGTFVSAGSGGLNDPRGLCFQRSGRLLAASFGSNQVLEYDGGTGAFIRQFNTNGPPGGTWAMQGPWGVRLGLDGQVYVSNRLGGHAVMMFDSRTGLFLRQFYVFGGGYMPGATGFDFVPGVSIDCNRNGTPDPCDLASGVLSDAGGDGVPDECQTDCDGNGRWDALDFIPLGDAADCNHNGQPDACDIAQGSSGDCDRDGVPDECQPDCNGNAVNDVCDAGTTSQDCNVNHVPDECELAAEPGLDCNANGILDACDVAGGASSDCNANGQPDDCEPGWGGDCNDNGVDDFCDLALDVSRDDDLDLMPDECEVLDRRHVAPDGGACGGPQAAGTPQDPYCSVAEAAATAGPGGPGERIEIVLADGVHRGPANREIDLRGRRIHVRGAGPARCVIDLESAGRAFLMSDGSQLSGVTIVNGAASDAALPGGGAVRASGRVVLRRCVLRHCQELTHLTGGGAVMAIGDGNAERRVLIEDCLLVENSTTGWGGAVLAHQGAGLELRRCTLAGNSSQYHGGGVTAKDLAEGQVLIVRDSILWGNQAKLGGPQVALFNAAVDVAYSDVQGGAEDIHDSVNGIVIWDTQTNLTIDPGFAPDPGGAWGDYHLATGSPLRGAGDPAAGHGGALDIDGERRVADGRLDIGADEVHDCNANAVADDRDVADGAPDADANLIPDECQPRLVHGGDSAFAEWAFAGYIDPRFDSALPGGDGLVDRLTLVFDRAVYAGDGGPPAAEAFVVIETGGLNPPQVVTVDAAANPRITLTLSRPLTLQAWTTVQAGVYDDAGRPVLNLGDLGPLEEPDRLDVGFLPGDIDQNGQVAPLDLVRYRQHISGTCATGCPKRGADVDYYDIDRNGVVDPLDLLRFRQLLLGAPPAGQVWALQSMNAAQP